MKNTRWEDRLLANYPACTAIACSSAALGVLGLYLVSVEVAAACFVLTAIWTMWAHQARAQRDRKGKQ